MFKPTTTTTHKNLPLPLKPHETKRLKIWETIPKLNRNKKARHCGSRFSRKWNSKKPSSTSGVLPRALSKRKPQTERALTRASERQRGWLSRSERRRIFGGYMLQNILGLGVRKTVVSPERGSQAGLRLLPWGHRGLCLDPAPPPRPKSAAKGTPRGAARPDHDPGPQQNQERHTALITVQWQSRCARSA